MDDTHLIPSSGALSRVSVLAGILSCLQGILHSLVVALHQCTQALVNTALAAAQPPALATEPGLCLIPMNAWEVLWITGCCISDVYQAPRVR